MTKWISDRVEQLHAEIAGEYNEAPGVVLRRIATAEFNEREAVLSFLKHAGSMTMQDAIQALEAGAHRV